MGRKNTEPIMYNCSNFNRRRIFLEDTISVGTSWKEGVDVAYVRSLWREPAALCVERGDSCLI
ncbi:hypothetical protein BgiMline_026550, partial [Biomphalaria glabrata]